MRKFFFALLGTSSVLSFVSAAAPPEKGAFPVDTIRTKKGDIAITCIGHGTLMLAYAGKVVHIDPYSRAADYSRLPKADVILVTHEHGDHLDTKAIDLVWKDTTSLILNQASHDKIKKGAVMKNGERREVQGFIVEAVPAYNIVSKRPDGTAFHPKGIGNGYVITCGETRIYVAGDTETIPEMAALKDIHCAFLPMNLPFTMTPEKVAEAAKIIKPKILYPYHYGSTDPKRLVELLKDVKEIEVRIRPMQ